MRNSVKFIGDERNKTTRKVKYAFDGSILFFFSQKLKNEILIN